MTKDNLKKFIKVEKQAFEEDFNEEEVWNNIESKINKKPNSFSINWFAAASVLLLLAVGWLGYDRFTLTDRLTKLENIQVEGNSLQQIENYYSHTISNKSKELKEISENIDYPLNQDLDTLQIQYRSLKEKLLEKGANDKIINAMILNLRTQIDLLNEQLEIIGTINNYSKTQKQKSNETQI